MARTLPRQRSQLPPPAMFRRPGRLSPLRAPGFSSEADYFEEVLESGKVARISGVEGESIGMCGRRDQQVGEPTSVRAARQGDRSDDLSITARRGGVEDKRIESRLDLLQASLAAGCFCLGGGQSGACRELG